MIHLNENMEVTLLSPVVLKSRPRASQMVAKSSTTELCLQALYILTVQFHVLRTELEP